MFLNTILKKVVYFVDGELFVNFHVTNTKLEIAFPVENDHIGSRRRASKSKDSTGFLIIMIKKSVIFNSAVKNLPLPSLFHSWCDSIALTQLATAELLGFHSCPSRRIRHKRLILGSSAKA